MSSRKSRGPGPTEMATVRDAVHTVERQFQKARLHFGHGTDNPRDEAAWLVATSLAIPFGKLDANATRSLDASERERIRQLAAQRIETRKPLAYLLNEAWFAGHRFYVDERVIVPRSLIGEFMASRFHPWVDSDRVSRILDLCTGSGCIAISAALPFPEATVDDVEISGEALDVARINVDAFQLNDRVNLIQSDLFSALGEVQYDLILTNPPYVDERDMATLPLEYRMEPSLALASGKHGLDAITRILVQAGKHLTPNGILIAEVGNSHQTLRRHNPDASFTWLQTPSGDDCVFLLDRERLLRFADRYRGRNT